MSKTLKAIAAAVIVAATINLAEAQHAATMETVKQSKMWRVLVGKGKCDCDTAVAEIASDDLQGSMMFKYSADRLGKITIIFFNSSWQIEKPIDVAINGGSVGEFEPLTNNVIESVRPLADLAPAIERRSTTEIVPAGQEPLRIAEDDARPALAAWEPYAKKIDEDHTQRVDEDNSLMGVLNKLNAKLDETERKLERIKALQAEINSE
jgi:hypothetical protein